MSPIDKILASEEGNKEEKSEMMQLVEALAKQVAKETVKEVLAERKICFSDNLTGTEFFQIKKERGFF